MWFRVLLGIVIILLIAGVGVRIYRSQMTAPKSGHTSQAVESTYTNTTFGYSLSLAKGWSICSSESMEPTVRIGKNQKCGIAWEESFTLTPTVGADYIYDRRQNEPFLFFVKRIEEEDQANLKSSGNTDYELTSIDPKTVLVESTYTPNDHSIKPKHQISLYREMTSRESIIINSEESPDKNILDKKTLIELGKSLQNSSILTGDLIGIVSKNIPNGQEIYPEYDFKIVKKGDNKQISLKSGSEGTYMMSLAPGEYILKAGSEEKPFTIEKGRILRLNFTAN